MTQTSFRPPPGGENASVTAAADDEILASREEVQPRTEPVAPSIDDEVKEWKKNARV